MSVIITRVLVLAVLCGVMEQAAPRTVHHITRTVPERRSRYAGDLWSGSARGIKLATVAVLRDLKRLRGGEPGMDVGDVLRHDPLKDNDELYAISLKIAKLKASVNVAKEELSNKNVAKQENVTKT